VLGHGDAPRFVARRFQKRWAALHRICSKVKGRWTYLHRSVDSGGQGIDCFLSAKRDASSAKRFLRKVLRQPHTVNPRTITVDKNAAYPKATAEMKRDDALWRWSRLG
jgi:IS6 family transposase